MCGAQLPDANLNGAGLRGADLRGADLRKTNLSGVNLSGANVQGAKFCGCSGLTDDTKLDLEKGGGNFKDSATESNSLVEENKRWLIQYVIVPLVIACIGSGGIVAIITAVKNEHPSPPVPVSTAKPTAQGTPSAKPMPSFLKPM